MPKVGTKIPICPTVYYQNTSTLTNLLILIEKPKNSVLECISFQEDSAVLMQKGKWVKGYSFVMPFTHCFQL